MIPNPCRDCVPPERSEYCHASCERYEAFRLWRAELAKKRLETLTLCQHSESFKQAIARKERLRRQHR